MTVAGVFGLPHLSEDAVAAFADGVLTGAAAGRARRHCAECAECAQAVQAQREAALLLRTAGNPTLPAGLLDRLAGVPMSTPLPPPCGGLPTMIGADGVPVLVAHDQQPAPDEPAETHRQAGGPLSVGRLLPGRRLLLPVGIIASAAAVLAAGAVGQTLSSVPHPVEQQPASVQLPGGSAQPPASSSRPRPATVPGFRGAVARSRPVTNPFSTSPASLTDVRPGAGGR